jgi:hypothetical protein
MSTADNHRVEAEWPPRWELTAPESHVLSYRGGSFRAEAIRLAVVELVARRILRVEDRSLVGGPAVHQAVEPPLEVVLEVFRETRRRPGRDDVLVKDFRRALTKRFRNADRYRELHVAPALVERGLLEETRPRRRGRAAEFDWTDAGREADAQLTRWLELGRDQLASWVRSDPMRASSFTREAGSAVLLMSDQYPELEELSRREGFGFADAGGAEAFTLGQAGGVHHHAPLDLGGGGLDLGGLDFGGLFDAGGLGDFGGGGDGGGGGGNGGG